MKERKIVNGIIDDVDVGLVNSIFLDVSLGINYGENSHKYFGGYNLYTAGEWQITPNYAGAYITEIFNVVGVEHLDELKNKAVRVVLEDSVIIGIGNFLKDEWLYPKEMFTKMRQAFNSVRERQQ